MVTKFGVPADSLLTVKYRSRNRSIFVDKNDNSFLYYELGIYSDENWVKVEKI
jgi:hypothetical protein